MPWKETNVMDQKKEFVMEAMRGEMNFTSLCAKFCISLETALKEISIEGPKVTLF